MGYCSINSSQIVFYRYTKDDGGLSNDVSKFWNIIVFRSIKIETKHKFQFAFVKDL